MPAAPAQVSTLRSQLSSAEALSEELRQQVAALQQAQQPGLLDVAPRGLEAQAPPLISLADEASPQQEEELAAARAAAAEARALAEQAQQEAAALRQCAEEAGQEAARAREECAHVQEELARGLEQVIFLWGLGWEKC